MKKSILGFCGMTHLGICSAVASISKGFQVTCFDPNQKTIINLKKGIIPIKEPYLEDALKKNNHLINFIENAQDLKYCDLIYISPDILTNSRGISDLKEINNLINIIVPYINKMATVVILSQVPPGFTRKIKKKINNLYYQVETLIFGEAYNRAMYPERYIIGCINKRDPLPDNLNYFLSKSNCPIIKMSYESAEFTKISINMCLISSITIANKMSEICENIGADWNEIIPALKLDKRIGKDSYIIPGLGLSGGNLERDIATTIKISQKYKIDKNLMDTFFQISNHRKDWVYKIIKNVVFPNISYPRIAILGLSYKPNTHSTKNAPSLILLKKLKQQSLIAYDPLVNVKEIAPWCEKALSIKKAVDKSDVLIILTPWDEIKKLDIKWAARIMNGIYFIDPFNVFEKSAITKEGLKYYSIGTPII